MFDFNRLLPGCLRMLESAAAPENYLLHRPDFGAKGFPIGASLAVAEGEFALLTSGNQIVNTLGPGIYLLDRTRLADFAAMYSWPENYAGATAAEILFVSMAARPRRVFHASMVPAQDVPTTVDLSGTIDFRISDCRRFAFAQIENGRFDDEAVCRMIESTIVREIRALTTEPDWRRLVDDADKADLEKLLQRRVHGRLEIQGIGETRIRIRTLHKANPAEAVLAVSAPDSAGTSGDNVARLPLGKQTNDRDSTTSPPSQPSRESAPDLEQALGEFERDIRRLDAWGSIQVRNHGTAGEENIASASEGADTTARRLPDSMRRLSFFIAVDMEQTGPFDAGEFEQAIIEGVVRAETLIWHQGMDDWKNAGDVPGIAELLQSG